MKKPALANIRVAIFGSLCIFFIVACGDDPTQAETPVRTSVEVSANAETVLAGELGSPFEGVRVVIPAGALPDRSTVFLTTIDDPTPLPSKAVVVGGQFAIGPNDLALSVPIQVTLPFDSDMVLSYEQDSTMVKVWLRGPADEAWSLVEPIATSTTGVTIEMGAAANIGAGIRTSE